MGCSESSAPGATAAACGGGRDGGRVWRGASARGWAPRGYAADRKPPGRAASGPSVICFCLFLPPPFTIAVSRSSSAGAAATPPRGPRAAGLIGAARGNLEPPAGPGRPPGPEAWAFGAALRRRPLQPALGAPGPGPGPAEHRGTLRTAATQSGPNRPPLARSLSELPPESPPVGSCLPPAVHGSMGGVLLNVPPSPFLSS